MSGVDTSHALASEIDVGAPFTEQQNAEAYPDGIENYWWHLARNEILVGALRATPSPRVLEVGCGRGTVVAHLRACGFDCRGVELGEVKPLAAAADHIQAETNAVALPMEERRGYDTLLLLDVIEHVPDPVDFLRRLVAAFPCLSRVIITAPACPELWSNYDEFYGHHRRYTVETLERLATDAGLVSRPAGYFFHAIYPAAWLIAARSWRRSTRPRFPRGRLNRWVHRLVARALVLEQRLVPRRVPGISVMGSFEVG